MNESAAYCENLVRESDKDRFLASLFVPSAQRADVFALYAFDLETGAIAARVRDPVAGEVRFQFWSDTLSGDDAAALPVAQAVRDVLQRHDLPVAPLLRLLDARRHALYEMPGIGDPAFEVLASETTAAICEMAARLLSGRDDEPLRLASLHAGFATLAARTMPDSPGRAEAIARHLEAVKDLIGLLPEAALPAYLPLVLLPPDRARLPQWRKQWILWRASRNLRAFM